MPKSPSHYLVVNPYLSYLAFAQRITAAKWKQVQAEFGEEADEIKVLPYTPQLQAVLNAQKEEYRSNRNYNVVFAFS